MEQCFYFSLHKPKEELIAFSLTEFVNLLRVQLRPSDAEQTTKSLIILITKHSILTNKSVQMEEVVDKSQLHIARQYLQPALEAKSSISPA